MKHLSKTDKTTSGNIWSALFSRSIGYNAVKSSTSKKPGAVMITFDEKLQDNPHISNW